MSFALCLATAAGFRYDGTAAGHGLFFFFNAAPWLEKSFFFKIVVWGTFIVTRGPPMLVEIGAASRCGTVSRCCRYCCLLLRIEKYLVKIRVWHCCSSGGASCRRCEKRKRKTRCTVWLTRESHQLLAKHSGSTAAVLQTAAVRCAVMQAA